MSVKYNPKIDITSDKTFDFHEMPMAYFCNNTKADKLRNMLIKNQIKINECQIGDLETIFFSDDNVELINKKLVTEIFKRSNGLYKISYQSKDKLVVVMRYVFIQYARHLPFEIEKQIRDLNCIVVSEILPDLMTNVTQRIDYLKEISEPRKINELPKYVHKDGKTLPSVFTTFI